MGSGESWLDCNGFLQARRWDLSVAFSKAPPQRGASMSPQVTSRISAMTVSASQCQNASLTQANEALRPDQQASIHSHRSVAIALPKKSSDGKDFICNEIILSLLAVCHVLADANQIIQPAIFD